MKEILEKYTINRGPWICKSLNSKTNENIKIVTHHAINSMVILQKMIINFLFGEQKEIMFTNKVRFNRVDLPTNQEHPLPHTIPKISQLSLTQRLAQDTREQFLNTQKYKTNMQILFLYIRS